jgi:hypothetical protein
MRSAPHSRVSLAISWIKATVSWEILGLREAARDLPTGCATSFISSTIWLESISYRFQIFEMPAFSSSSANKKRGH